MGINLLHPVWIWNSLRMTFIILSPSSQVQIGGNSSQHKKLQEDLENAVKRIKQSNIQKNVQSVLGICYGKTKTTCLRGYMKAVGQNFWFLISGNKELYKEIIEPIGYRAKEHNDAFYLEKNRVVNRFTKQFLDNYCNEIGEINWYKLVEFNSGNYDLDRTNL